MKESFFVIVLIFLINASTTIYPQTKKNIDVGIIAGANYSGAFVNIPQYYIGEEQITPPEDYYKYRFGYFGGITFNYYINKYFGVGGDLIYALKGYNFDNSIDQKEYIRLHYLELPFLMNFYFLQNQKLTSSVYLGPYLSYLIEGRYDIESPYYSSSGKIDVYDDFDYGITAGVSFLFPLQANKIGIDLRYDWGLNNIFKGNLYWGEDQSLKNSSFMLGVKFLFNIKQKSSFEEENSEDDDIWN